MSFKECFGKLIKYANQLIFEKILRINVILIRDRFFYFLKDKYPSIKNPFLFRFNPIKCLMFIIEIKTQEFYTRLKYGTKKLFINNNCRINPQKIKFYQEKQLNEYSSIMRGVWDQSKIKIEGSPIYKAFNQRFHEGKKWQETEFYQTIIGRITNNEIKRDFKNKEEFDKKFSEIDAIYYQLTDILYETQEEQTISNKIFEKLKTQEIFNNISVAIDREGQLLVVEGLYKFLITKLLKIPEIPIFIKARHKKWIDFRKELFLSSRNYQIHKMFYQRFTHPDLQSLPYKHGDHRFNLIKKNLHLTRGTLLDIGANFGYFCYKFEDEGFDCYAVEPNPMHVYFMKKLKKAENKQFKIIAQSIFEYQKGKELVFDVVLALNIFYHFCKNREAYLSLIKLLKRLKTKILYFEAHDPTKLQNANVYRNYNPNEFLEFIINNSCLNKYKFIGKTKYGRSLYELSSDCFS